MDEDWEALSSSLPSDWREQAAAQGALKGLRKDKSPDALLRTLLMHLGCGHSLRETAARARQAGIADVSVVALFKRLRKSKEWLRALSVGMYRERGVELGASEGFQVRAFDGSVVSEPGRTGSLWRVHYGLRLPALACDHFEVTKAKGEGCGETLKRFPIGRGDHVVADRGHSTAGGLMHVEAAGGYATVRVNTRSLRFRTPGGRRPFDLLAAVSAIKRAGTVRSWRARAVGRDGKGVVGRVCAMKKSAEDARQAREKLRRRAVHKGPRAAAGDAGVRRLRDRVHDLPGGAVPGGGGAAVVPGALAGGADVQALQVAGGAGASAEALRRQRPGVAVRQAAGGPDGGEAGAPRRVARRFPLRGESEPGGAVPGGSSSSR